MSQNNKPAHHNKWCSKERSLEKTVNDAKRKDETTGISFEELEEYEDMMKTTEERQIPDDSIKDDIYLSTGTTFFPEQDPRRKNYL